MPDTNDSHCASTATAGMHDSSDGDNQNSPDKSDQETPLAVAVPAGHFYSPIPSIDEVRKDADTLFLKVPRTLPGIDFREDAQLRLLETFADRYYNEMPFSETQPAPHRFYFENIMFSYADALSLYCMLRHFAPKRVIEVGSGFSSAVTLDTNELFFDGHIKTTFIEPYPNRLLSLLRNGDAKTQPLFTVVFKMLILDFFPICKRTIFCSSIHRTSAR